MFKRFRYLNVFLLAVILAVGVTYIQLPFYITKPGLAEELKPYVKVENGYKEEGDFMLVTVSMSKANIVNYLTAKWNKYHEIYKEEEILQKGQSDEDYQFQQLYMMKGSQDAAKLNAYTRAHKSVTINNKGVLVLDVVKGMPAYGKLKLGDHLQAVDGTALKTAQEFIDYMNMKKQGDAVTIEFTRDKTKKSETFQLQPIKGAEGRVGIGVAIVTDQELEVEPKVAIDSHRIGGPSAGMMFTLEIYNQLTKEDLTKGHKIAGTGTIDEKGQVGPIGGISQKIVAASNAGAEIFFAPNEQGDSKSNYKEAVKTAKDIGTKMKIIPVDTLDDALAYLEKLKK
ncbi:SepM family pheromone-processing serine protease [Bacillus sp. 165]|uniref:SepM family pheromone-processing serine protease n=1 Tax=Bacillus sp. 165 TaxID=1529117 RepID=UPI001ADA6FF1|nr:SepM family pheromone-processing serine protease [Bacillus sp. 165]MBO9130280.1 PDZ domain-containing protein [Bacillus sp. 165]